jgi:two-component system, OmpR family, sensor histidine kinase CreC
MKSRAPEKWRPSLGLVVSVALASVAMLPLVGLFFFRLYDNQLIHQTEAELVAQGRVLAAVYARDVEARLGDGIALGAEIQPESRPDREDQMTPIRPALDLAADGDLLRRRPNALPATTPASPTYVEIGTKLMPIVLETQKVTLAGFRILDPRGVVIAGRDEVGQSLAHIEEVATALQGQYRAVLRTRKPDKPPPPIYSVSRGVGVHVFSAMPVIVGNRVAGVVYTSRTPSNIFAHLYQERGKFILAGLAVVLATAIIGLIFARTITRPMHELVDRAARIGRGDRNAFQPLAHYGTREFAQLSHSFLDMAEQLSRRSDYIATFSAHLTHELKSPLTSIKGAAELLLDSLQSPSDNLSRMEQKNFISNILSDTGRLEVMTQRLRELARAEAAPLNEHTELSHVIGGLKSRFPTRAIEAAGALDRSIGMSGEKALIVLSHLTDNAIRHNAKRVRLEAVEENSSIKVTVSNDGDPISESNREKIFDAFFTTRRDTGGTGMGLAIAQAVMTSHGGSIRLLPSEPGVAFELRVPVV